MSATPFSSSRFSVQNPFSRSSTSGLDPELLNYLMTSQAAASNYPTQQVQAPTQQVSAAASLSGPEDVSAPITSKVYTREEITPAREATESFGAIPATYRYRLGDEVFDNLDTSAGVFDGDKFIVGGDTTKGGPLDFNTFRSSHLVTPGRGPTSAGDAYNDDATLASFQEFKAPPGTNPDDFYYKPLAGGLLVKVIDKTGKEVGWLNRTQGAGTGGNDAINIGSGVIALEGYDRTFNDKAPLPWQDVYQQQLTDGFSRKTLNDSGVWVDDPIQARLSVTRPTDPGVVRDREGELAPDQWDMSEGRFNILGRGGNYRNSNGYQLTTYNPLQFAMDKGLLSDDAKSSDKNDPNNYFDYTAPPKDNLFERMLPQLMAWTMDAVTGTPFGSMIVGANQVADGNKAGWLNMIPGAMNITNAVSPGTFATTVGKDLAGNVVTNAISPQQYLGEALGATGKWVAPVGNAALQGGLALATGQDPLKAAASGALTSYIPAELAAQLPANLQWLAKPGGLALAQTMLGKKIDPAQLIMAAIPRGGGSSPRQPTQPRSPS